MYNNMRKGQKEARIGLDSEKDIIKEINTNKQFRDLIKQCLENLGFNLRGDIKAHKDDVKIDIFIENNIEIGVSIKTSSKTSFHSLDRRCLEKWKESLNMSDNIFKILKEAILRVAQDRRSRFILERDEKEIRDFFIKHIINIINEIFTRGEKELKLLMLNDKRRYKLYLYKMEDVINYLVRDIQGSVGFSPKGIVRLGDFITVQRKGGNGYRITIPKTNWDHPGNQLQFKFSPLKFVEDIENNKAIKMCIIQFYPRK